MFILRRILIADALVRHNQFDPSPKAPAASRPAANRSIRGTSPAVARREKNKEQRTHNNSSFVLCFLVLYQLAFH